MAAIVLVQAAAFLGLGGRGGRASFVLNMRRIFIFQFGSQMLFAIYWGAYWGKVYAHLPEVAAQACFAFLFDSLVSWWRRGSFQFGLSALPIVGSVNLFIWFVPSHFGWQLALISIAILGKACICWERDGNQRHIFNPSALPMAMAAIATMCLNPTDIAYGQSIPSTQELGPHVYDVLFLIGLCSNIWYRQVLVTASVFLTYLGLNNLVYFVAGARIVDLPITAPIFLAATLLVSDPATSPATKCGKVFYGVFYGAAVLFLPLLFFTIDQPSFSEKVIVVPLINLLVPWFDRMGRKLSSIRLGRLDGMRGPLGSHRFHLAVWGTLFLLLDPSLKEGAFQLREPPAWAIPPENVVRATVEERNLCRERPKICAPYHLFDELKYLWERNTGENKGGASRKTEAGRRARGARALDSRHALRGLLDGRRDSTRRLYRARNFGDQRFSTGCLRVKSRS